MIAANIKADVSYDICIIGSGAAGLYLASVLAANAGLRICILEAGPWKFGDRVEPYSVTSTKKVHTGVNEARITAWGGATNTWGGGLVRASPYDFAAIQEDPRTKWPLQYADFERHYAAVEEFFGIPSTPWNSEWAVHAEEGWRAVRRDVPILSFSKKNFGKSLGPALTRKKNVDIICNAQGWCWDTDGHTDRPVVRLAGGAGPSFCIRARHFVVAAGIVNSIVSVRQLLQQLGWPLAEKCGIGFHDHLSFPIAVIRPRSAWKFSLQHAYRFANGLMWATHYDLETKSGVDPGAFLHFTADMTASPSLRVVRNVLYYIQNGEWDTEGLRWQDLTKAVTGLPAIGLMRYLWKRVLFDESTHLCATVDIEQAPSDAHDLRTNADGREVSVTWDVTIDDARIAVLQVERAEAVLKSVLRDPSVVIQSTLPANYQDLEVMRDHLRKSAQDTYHAAGGLRFGDDLAAPVDQHLRLRGCNHVSVLSTAVFPRVGTSNPTLTLLALAHRLSERLSTDVASEV